VSARLLNAMYFGVPQSRQRLIFIGVREDLGIELKVPSEPRHFRMAAGTTQGIAEFEQWTITDVKSSYQFYIVSGDHEYEEIDLFMQAEVLNAAPRPAVGFMVKAIETGSRRFVQGELLVEEQSWLQEDRRSRAISRTYVLPGKILQLICVFPSEETDRASVSYFFDSFNHWRNTYFWVDKHAPPYCSIDCFCNLK